MTTKSKKDRIAAIIDALSEAALGDYSKKIDITSKEDELDSIAQAINKMLEKTDKRLDSLKQTRSKLKVSEMRYKNILDSMQESYFEVDLKGNMLFFNDAVVLNLGYTPEDLKGMNFEQFVDKENGMKVYEAFHRVFITGEEIKGFDWEILKKNGGKLDVESSVSLLLNDKGESRGFRGVVRDITKRKQAEQQLLRSEEKYRGVLENMEEGLFEHDLKGNYTFVNNAACRLLGYEHNEMIGMNFRKVIQPDTAKYMREVFRRIYKTGKPEFLLDYEVVRKDGSTRVHQANAAVIRDQAGKVNGFIGLVRDITERTKIEEARRVSEEKYRDILEIMREGYFEVDLHGTITYANDAGCKLHGYEHGEMIGINFRHFSPPETARRIYEVYRKIYDTHMPELMLNCEVIHKDGLKRIHQQNAMLLFDESGQPKGFRALIRDVTEQVMAEEALHVSEEKYRGILENMEETYLETDLKGNFVLFNDSLCLLLGYSRAELLNMNYRNCIEPQTIPSVIQIFNEIYRTNKPKTFITHELIAKNGSKKIVEMSVSLRCDLSGEPVGFHGIARDVTAKNKAEEALKESERRYRMITDNIRDTIWTMDFNLNYTYLSPSIEQLTGYSMEELTHIPLSEQLTPASFSLVEKIIQEEFVEEDNKQPRDPNASRIMEVELIHKDGTTLWAEVIVSFNRDKDGKPIEILGVTRDISERKKVELALEESEKRYRMIVENMQDTIWTMNLDLEYTYQSPSEVRVTGFTAEEMMQIPVREQLTPESYMLAEKMFAEELELELSGKSVDPHRYRTMELEIYKKNGGTIWEEVTVTFNRDGQGKPVEILFTGRDITARRIAQNDLKESEKRYRMIVENMHDTITVLDLNLQEIYRSPSRFMRAGYTHEEYVKIPMRERLTPESYTMVVNILAEELTLEERGKRPEEDRSVTLEVEAYHKYGGTIWLELTVKFIRDESGKPTGILIAGRDISERKKIQQEKEKLEEQLLHAQKMESIGRLAGGVAHDFNNMLNVILGYAELSKMRLAQDNPVMHNIVEIEKAASRSKEITSQLLAFSRKQIIAPKIINLNEQIKYIEKTIARLIGEDISLFFHTQSDLWNIKIDPSQVEQILFNLIINARDAMQGGGKLTVETVNLQLDDDYSFTHADFEPGQYVLLTVSDNGHGIDKETLKHIFEPFFTTKETGKGTGLGLATVYGIVKQNSGFINVYSEQGQGTAFKIYFRRTEEIKPLEEVEEEVIARASGTILLVEDDLPLREMTEEMLQTIGYEVLTVNNPMEAVTLCEKEDKHIDLVITDVVMPEMNGRELRDKLVLVRPDIKVLFMSGYTTDVIAHHGVLEEGVHFLQKPFSMKNLAQKISEVTAGE